MLDRNDIEKLANLARIAISPEESDAFLSEIEPILGYVAQVKEVSGSTYTDNQIGLVKNIMREDNNPHESGHYTKDVLAQAPQVEDEYIKVKKILE